MPGTIDDRRAASNITASLSSYLITAALGVIAAEVVIVTFVIDKRENLFWFFLFSGLGLAASTISIYFGGKGIGQLIKLGFDGDWIIKTQGGHFNTQAVLALGSLLLVAVSVFCGSPKAEKATAPPNTQALSDGMRDLQNRVNNLESNARAISAKVDTLSAKLSERNKTSSHKKK